MHCANYVVLYSPLKFVSVAVSLVFLFLSWSDNSFWQQMPNSCFIHEALNTLEAVGIPDVTGLSLVLAGTELIFFTVSSMRLCSGFVLKTVLIIQRCFSHCWAVLTQSQGLFCFSPHPTSEWAEGAQEAGRGHKPGQLSPTDQWDVPYHTTSCSADKVGGRRRKRRDVWSDGDCLPKSPWWSPAFLAVPEHLPASGKEWMNSLLCLCVQLLLYLLNRLYLSPRVFSLSHSWIYPHLTSREWVSSCLVLSCQLGLNPACFCRELGLELLVGLLLVFKG